MRSLIFVLLLILVSLAPQHLSINLSDTTISLIFWTVFFFGLVWIGWARSEKFPIVTFRDTLFNLGIILVGCLVILLIGIRESLWELLDFVVIVSSATLVPMISAHIRWRMKERQIKKIVSQIKPYNGDAEDEEISARKSLLLEVKNGMEPSLKSDSEMEEYILKNSPYPWTEEDIEILYEEILDC